MANFTIDQHVKRKIVGHEHIRKAIALCNADKREFRYSIAFHYDDRADVIHYVVREHRPLSLGFKMRKLWFQYVSWTDYLFFGYTAKALGIAELGPVNCTLTLEV